MTANTIPPTEPIEFHASVSLKHLPRDKWEALLAEATYRVARQLGAARKIAWSVISGSSSTSDVIQVYDRLSELMPRPFPDIQPAQEEDEPAVEEEYVPGTGPALNVGLMSRHKDTTGGADC